jgi:hypothetical protein
MKDITTYRMQTADDNSESQIVEVVLKSDYKLLETTLLELTKEVEEWVCEDCKRVYLKAMLLPGTICVICPKCEGATMPVSMYERRKMSMQLNAVMGERNDMLKNLEMRDKQIKMLQKMVGA